MIEIHVLVIFYILKNQALKTLYLIEYHLLSVELCFFYYIYYEQWIMNRQLFILECQSVNKMCVVTPLSGKCLQSYQKWVEFSS